jgi:hypothetical protein
MSEELKLGEKEPAILYHYTTLDGLNGIIKDKKLWMSDFRYMNDSNEFWHGVGLFLNSFLSEEHQTFFNKENRIVSTKQLFQSFIKLIASQHPAFITCFSEENDLLDLWRGYGKKGGYSLGIKTEALSNPFTVWDKVDYTDNAFNLNNDIEKLSEFVNQTFTDEQDFRKKLASNEYKNFLLRPLGYCNLVKHNGFANEKEWRFFTLFSQDKNQEFVKSLEFIPNASLLKPIMHLSIDTVQYPDWLKSITVGPMAYQELAATSLEMFLKSQNLEKVEVICSEIPYREF